ncbi:hypothetical protein LUZ61_016404 [Rhynchospora tenuis]|uniref:Uncharacterized protein n=1 Tax=Rhynchospora tenuis TaxID=198213 RepID=A0AAD6EJZ1_9POAL|nr:hypothetical protein LUZ61_016404 [Rhynchospora tenuis]
MYNLPPGLFPDAVTSYTLSESGLLTVSLPIQCFLGSGYELVYHPKVTGIIRNGSIEEIQGMESMYFHFWFWVRSIRADLLLDDYVYFDLGWFTRMVPVSLFDIVPSCNHGPPVSLDSLAQDAFTASAGIA